jgi:HSP20 family protein
MSSLMRWEPMREGLALRDWMDRFLEDAWFRPMTGVSGVVAPAVDLYANDEEVVVKATLPGVQPEDLNISVTGDVLTIRGEIKDERTLNGGNGNYHLRERRMGSFARALPLPTAVVADKARAEFENGILTLTLPKAEEVKAKTIPVQAK